MSVAIARTRPAPEETRARILAVAEEHFHRVGYTKTTVADIAAALGMSPANVYRFFSSKAAINEAICGQLMEEIDRKLRAVVAGGGSARERLATFVMTLHHHNKTRLTSERRIHEMVEAAMAENWDSIAAHCDCVKGMIAELVQEGVAAGEFAPIDPQAAGQSVFEACVCLFHPTLITQCPAEHQEAQAERLVSFVLRALAR